MSEVRVLLADDHTIVRAGLRILVEGFEGFQVVAEAGDGREAVRLARQLKPDIALLDIGMPRLNGLDAAALIAKEAPGTQIVILSMHTAENYVLEALRAGAVGRCRGLRGQGRRHRRSRACAASGAERRALAQSSGIAPPA